MLGNPLDEATTLGPMANVRFADWVRKQTAEALAKGAKAHIDAAGLRGRRSASTAYLAPQVLTGVDHSMSVMTEESFGPVVGIMKVSSDEEAIRLMNDSPYGLTAAIWTAGRRCGRAHRRRDRDRHGVHEPLRLSRSRPGLDGRQGHRPRHRPLAGSAIEALTQPKSYHLRHLDRWRIPDRQDRLQLQSRCRDPG